MHLAVIIPAYNASRFIAATLRSVLSQTLAPAEVIVVDDGSTDDTASIAESFGSPVRVLRCSNSGQAAARNLAVQQATSEWIAFMDADDLWEPDKLEKQCHALQSTPGADLCYTARVCFEQQDDVLHRAIVIDVPPPSSIRKALFRSTSFLPSSVVMRRSTFLAAGGFDTRYTIVEDWDLWLRLLHAGTRFAACHEPLLLYRTHPGALSRRADVALDESLEIYRNRVLPHLSGPLRRLHYNRVRSEHEAVTSMVLRSNHDPRALRLMLSSILRDPFHYPHRYKVLAHMLFTRWRHLAYSAKRPTGVERYPETSKPGAPSSPQSG